MPICPKMGIININNRKCHCSPDSCIQLSLLDGSDCAFTASYTENWRILPLLNMSELQTQSLFWCIARRLPLLAKHLGWDRFSFSQFWAWAGLALTISTFPYVLSLLHPSLIPASMRLNSPSPRPSGLSKSFPLDNSLFDSWLAQSVQITADDMLSQWTLGAQHRDKSGSLLSDQVGIQPLEVKKNHDFHEASLLSCLIHCCCLKKKKIGSFTFKQNI